MFPGSWTEGHGPDSKPPRSPDLNLADFFLCGSVKNIVYAAEVQSPEDLRQRIDNASEFIRRLLTIQDVFEDARESLRRHAEACITAN